MNYQHQALLALCRDIVANYGVQQFNPLTDIPRTDEEAEKALRFGRDELVGANLCGIYQTFRAQGRHILQAYQATLEMLLERQQ